ncbi:uncharacterized protein VTP21DRAFT_9720 [Calcarisporiella thermophila]|uniref:uncharacterized protein n=1 Tax=Calcarisporiella thermophila TaxID=911321 RepID=UPI0037440C87
MEYDDFGHQNTNSIKDYEIGKLIGKGAFGRVYKAIGRQGHYAGQEVAIKMIDKTQAPNLRKRMKSEVEIHWNLQHPAILSLYDYFEDATHIYLVMELCEKGELYQYLQKRALLSEAEARGVMRRLVEGLMYLHSQGIVHRDLKLSNILLTKEYEVKIADFGLATRVRGSSAEQITMCGTPNYISPEILSRQPYGLSTDVWSLGCMLITFLTGKPPFESKEMKNTLERVQKADYKIPSHLSIEARDLIHRMLQPDPKLRLPLSQILIQPFFDSHRSVIPLSDPELLLVRTLTSEERKARAELVRAQQQQHMLGTGKFRHHFEENQERIDPISHKISWPSAQERDSLHLNPMNVHEIQKLPSIITANSTTMTNATSTGVTSPAKVNTIRLKPIRQQTRHGRVEILPNKRVLVDFSDSRHPMIISSDGEVVDVYERGSASVKDWAWESAQPLRTYRYTNLPPKLAKRYRYACRFIELIRSKTPKVIYYSPMAKCMLMEQRDFEMIWHNGTRIHHSVTKDVLEIKKGEQVHRLSTRERTLSVSSELASLLQHAKECLRQCLEAERTESHFPHVFGKDINASKADRPRSLDYGLGNARCEKASDLGRGGRVNPCDREKENVFGGLVKGNTMERIARSGSLSSRTPETKMHDSGVAVTNFLTATSISSNVPKYGSAPSASFPSSLKSTRDSNPTTPYASSPIFYFMEGIGWCFKLPDAYYLCLSAGDRLEIHTRQHSVIYYPRAGGKEEYYPIDEYLPDYVEEKLAVFRIFAQKFNSGSEPRWWV